MPWGLFALHGRPCREGFGLAGFSSRDRFATPARPATLPSRTAGGGASITQGSKDMHTPFPFRHAQGHGSINRKRRGEP